MSNVALISQYLAHRIKDAEWDLNDFSEELAKNPLMALRGAQGTYRAAAELEIATQLVRMIRKLEELGKTSAEIFEELRSDLTKDILRTAADDSSGKSDCDALLEKSLQAARTRMLSIVADYV